MQLSIEGEKKRKGGQIALTERQIKIIEFMQRNGKITSGDLQKMFQISRQAIHKEIRKMAELDIIEQKGSGKAIFYVLK